MIGLWALFDVPSTSKFRSRLSRQLVSENYALRLDSTFLQDLSVDFWVLVEVVSFLQTFLKALNSMVGLAMLELLWALDTDLDLRFEKPFLWVEMRWKHTQACEPRISGKHPCPDWKGRFSKTCTGVIGVNSRRK